MHTLKMREKNTQEQTKPIFDLFKDSLEDVIDSNIDNRISSRNNFYDCQNQAHQLFNYRELFYFYLGSSAMILR